MKDNKSTLNKRIKSYSAVAGSLMAATAANGQVIYTDVNPDSTLYLNTSYALDLNNDGISDFNLEQRSGTYAGFDYYAVAVYPLDAMNAVDTVAGGSANAANSGYVVDSSSNWIDSTAMVGQNPPLAAALAVKIPAVGYSFGNFIGAAGKFLPLRFDVEGDLYYGWVRLDVDADAKQFTVIDYAYTGTPNGAALTGSLAGIAEDGLNNHVSIFSADQNVTVKLDATIPAEGLITVRNLIGQQVASKAVNSSETIIPMQSVKAGIYLVTINQGNSAYTKKVHIR